MMGLAWSTLVGEALSDLSVLKPSISFWAKKLLPVVFVTVVDARKMKYNWKCTYFSCLFCRQATKPQTTVADRKAGTP